MDVAATELILYYKKESTSRYTKYNKLHFVYEEVVGVSVSSRYFSALIYLDQKNIVCACTGQNESIQSAV